MIKLCGVGIALLPMAVLATTAACISDSSTATPAVREEIDELGGVQIARIDTVVMPWGEVRYDTIPADASPSAPNNKHWRAEAEARIKADPESRYSKLTDEDYQIVADELGVETAAMKAVVRIEAGATLEGFVAPGVPVVNFDRSVYNKVRPTSKAKASASESVPSGIKNPRARSEWSQLVQARKVNREKADMGTFWGMFQIGGFNYKLCGCSSVQEFVDRMCFSEFEQLQLFANFITNSGMLNDLRNKNWSAFARKYNGTSYAARGYHTRMANAYAKFKKEESAKQTSKSVSTDSDEQSK